MLVEEPINAGLQRLNLRIVRSQTITRHHRQAVPEGVLDT